MLCRHPALRGLRAGNAAPRRSLKSSGRKATRGHINKAGSPVRPSVAAAAPAAEAGFLPLPSARAPRGESMGAQRLFRRRRTRLPRGRAPTRGFQEASAGLRPPARSPWSAARVLVGAHGRREPSPPRGRAASPRRCGRRLRGPGGKWKGQGVKARLQVEPNFAAGAAGGHDACARARGSELTAQLWAVSREEAPPAPPPAPSVAAARPRAPANNRRP